MGKGAPEGWRSVEGAPESSFSQLLVFMYINREKEISSGFPFMYQQTSCLEISFKMLY